MVTEDRTESDQKAGNNVPTKKFSYVTVAEGVTILAVFSVVGAAFGIWVRVDGFDVRVDKSIAKNERRLDQVLTEHRRETNIIFEEHKLLIFALRKDIDVVARDLDQLEDECGVYSQWQTGLYRNSDKLETLLVRFDNLFDDFREHEKAPELHK